MNKLKILVVDDDKITTGILLKMLENDEREIVLANSGLEGLEKYKSFAPDILLSDINMPGMNGLEMITKIRAFDKQIKIAIFTNFDNKAYLLEAIHLGVNQFFCKPFEKEHFLEVIKGLTADILQRRFIECSLNRHQNILEAVNKMSQSFLQQKDWNETLSREMRSLKEAADASALFIFKNEESHDPKIARSYLSLNDNSDAKPKNIHPYNSLNVSSLKDKLSDAQSFNYLKDDVSDSDKTLFYEYRVDSLLILPIFCNDTWWGFLGIGNNDNRGFDSTSENTLKTATQLIGAALDNQYNLNMLKMRSAIFKHTVDGVFITNSDNKIIHVNDAFTNITGFFADNVYQKDPKILRSGKNDKMFYRNLWQDINDSGYWQGEIKNRKKNGEMYIAWLSINAIKDRRGKIENYIGVFSDVTAQRSDDDHYAHLATHDALTGLSNRLILNDRLEHAISHADRAQKKIAVLFCDLDNFKPINDTFGHDVGDNVLVHCAKYFRKMLRMEDTICRYGGDEFVIILEDLDDDVILQDLLDKVMTITDEPAVIGKHTISIEMSVGVSVYPVDCGESECLIKQADKAMYSAKHAGKNQILFYKSEDKA